MLVAAIVIIGHCYILYIILGSSNFINICKYYNAIKL